jgi:lysophospholipase L1-like esterase
MKLMIKIYLFLFFTFQALIIASQQNTDLYTYADFSRFEKENAQLDRESFAGSRVVFMGNSITEAWLRYNPELFSSGQFINRGISGQVTAQMLMRFRADVIDLSPKVVVILAGINDIAENSGYIPLDAIANNIKSMAEIADQNKISVVLCAVLPAIDFPWRKGLDPAPKVAELNNLIKKYALEKGFPYVDYYTIMADENGGLKVPDFTSQDDLVHPNKRGYEVMEGILIPVISRLLKE